MRIHGRVSRENHRQLNFYMGGLRVLGGVNGFMRVSD